MSDDFIDVVEDDGEKTVFRCPVCNAGDITIHKYSPIRYGYCDVCGSAYIHYVPLEHQLDVHESKAKLKLLIGGMGSAKSEAGVLEIIDHALTVPNGRTLMLAQTLKQLGAAIMPKFAMYLPDKYVDKWVDTKNDKYIRLVNGHEIIGFASDDEEKFRSLDITAFLLEEASGIKRSVYEELIRRMRSPMGMINGTSRYLGIIISNPSQGFIRDLLFEASYIKGSKSIAETVKRYKDRIITPNKDLHAFLSSSRDNKYLPEGFVESVINSLTPAQSRLYVDCIIEYAEGAVYADFLSYVEDDFNIPDEWERYLAHDPGIRDPSAILIGAIDPETGVIHFYKEYYKTDQVLSTIASNIKNMTKDIPVGMLNPMLIDPSANQRNKINGRTYKQQLNLEHGLVFIDANNRIIDGIFKARDFMARDKVRVFRSLVNTIREGCEYRYPTKDEVSDKKNIGDKPLDKDNHLMDCLRYIIQAVPYNILSKKVVYDSNSYGRNFLIGANNEEDNNGKYQGGYKFDKYF